MSSSSGECGTEFCAGHQPCTLILSARDDLDRCPCLDCLETTLTWSEGRWNGTLESCGQTWLFEFFCVGGEQYAMAVSTNPGCFSTMKVAYLVQYNPLRVHYVLSIPRSCCGEGAGTAQIQLVVHEGQWTCT